MVKMTMKMDPSSRLDICVNIQLSITFPLHAYGLTPYEQAHLSGKCTHYTSMQAACSLDTIFNHQVPITLG